MFKRIILLKTLLIVSIITPLEFLPSCSATRSNPAQRKPNGTFDPWLNPASRYGLYFSAPRFDKLDSKTSGQSLSLSFKGFLADSTSAGSFALDNFPSSSLILWLSFDFYSFLAEKIPAVFDLESLVFSRVSSGYLGKLLSMWSEVSFSSSISYYFFVGYLFPSAFFPVCFFSFLPEDNCDSFDYFFCSMLSSESLSLWWSLLCSSSSSLSIMFLFLPEIASLSFLLTYTNSSSAASALSFSLTFSVIYYFLPFF